MEINELKKGKNYVMIFPYKTFSKVVEILDINYRNKETLVRFVENNITECLNQIEVQRYIKELNT